MTAEALSIRIGEVGLPRLVRFALLALVGLGVAAIAWTSRYQPTGMVAGGRGIVVWDRWAARSCTMPTRGRGSCGQAWWVDPLGIEARRAQQRRLAEQAEALRRAELLRREECQRILSSAPPLESPTDDLAALTELIVAGKRSECERILGH